MTTTAHVPVDDFEAPTPLEVAFLTYRDEGLRLPPVPHEMVPGLQRTGPWRFASKGASVDLGDRAAWEAGVRDGTLAPHVQFGHIGHGVASWNMIYSLVLDSVAIYVRLAYGNAFQDANVARMRFNAAIVTIEEIVVLAEEAKAAGKLPESRRVVVIEESNEPDGGFVVTDDWKQAEHALAMAWSELI